MKIALALTLILQAGSGKPFRDLKAPIAGAGVVVDQGGEPVLVVAAGNKIQGTTFDGRAAVGYPVLLGEDTAVGDLAAADFDGDGRADIAVTTAGGKLYVLSNGNIAAGFPITVASKLNAGPVFADIDGDGRPELLIGDPDGRLHVFNHGGKELAPFPITLREALTSPPSVGKLRGETAIAIGGEKGSVFVLDSKGSALPGFPLATHFTVAAAPVFGDVDDDGQVDLVVPSGDFSLYVVNAAGEALAGFPVHTGLACYGAPALADLDGDDVLDIAFTSGDGNLYALNGRGEALPHFPVKLSANLRTAVAVADFSRDGKVELVTSGADGALFVVSTAGKILSTTRSGTQPAASVIVGRGKDGAAVAFAGNADGRILSVRLDQKKANAGPASIPWATAGHDVARSGWFRPNPLRYKELTLTPEKPRIDDALKAAWTFFSVDGKAEPAAPISWFRNGARVKELDGQKTLAARTAKKHERWHYELTLPTRVAKSPAVTIEDSEPTPPVLRIAPALLSVEHDARVEIAEPAKDADGDPVSYRYAWLVDGQRANGLTTAALPAARVKKGQRWTAIVTPFDGEREGNPGIAEATVGNSPPGAPVFALKPSTFKQGETLKPVLQKAAHDPDNDQVQYRYRWEVNGKPRNDLFTQAELPTPPLRKGDRVAVSITAFDGLVEGAAWRGEAAIVNTPPEAPELAFAPAAPRAGAPLRVLVAKPSHDADRDSVSYRAAWQRNGQPYAAPGDGFEIPASEVKKGDRWSVVVTPNDGEADGKPAKADVRVINTQPTAPLISLKPAAPTVDDAISVVLVSPSTDIDSDPVKYSYQWSHNGATLGSAGGKPIADTLPRRQAKKHERVRVVVTPSDGSLNGTPGSAEVEIANAIPTAPVIALEPAAPTVLAALRAVIRTSATDADGDKLAYRYRWLLDGSTQSFPESQSEIPAARLKKGQRWTVRVRAFDQEVEGPEAVATIDVGNAAPPAPRVELLPVHPRRGEQLHAHVSEVADADADPLTWRFSWKRNGAPVALPPNADTISAELPRKGEKWSVDVVVNDALADSPPAHAEVVIGNTPPTQPHVSLCEKPIFAGEPIQLAVQVPSHDVDEDNVRYEYAWTVNDQARPAWATRTALGKGDTHKHERLRLTVTPFDGTDRGLPATAECEVQDSPPGAAQISLEPPTPSAESGLRVRIDTPGADLDGDAVQYRYRWTRDGLPFDRGGDGSRIGPRVLHRGEVLAVTVVSFDGEREGGSVSASTTTQNTPPAAPKLKVPPSAITGAELRCEAAFDAKDIDGDTVDVHRRWLRNGEPAAVAADRETLPPALVHAGDGWRCEAWTDDGFETSAHVNADIHVENSAPEPPRIAIEPEAPKTDDDLRCRITADATDLDGDALSYRYSWTKNGAAVSISGEPSVVPHELTTRGETWRCNVVALDGKHESNPTVAEVKIVNSPPGAAVARVGPRPAVADQPLRCELVEPAVDPDGDKVEHHFFWAKDGVAQSFAVTSQEVPGRLVKPREIWTCEVQATDGELAGPKTSGGSAAVQ